LTIPLGFDPALQRPDVVPPTFANGTTRPEVRATGVCHRHRRNGHPLCRPLDRRDRSSIRCCTIAFRRPPQAHPTFVG